ncbi:hypothetical protein PoB_000605100 [Plakobranchus ocellatus]|uniref:Uncharacterized protein n=1 Tax=Plakobranchus ocellatus TaxID=259542 RepID=A0AAV3Y8J8_9GAST|nr:hypothetical protein PoB_000605100 [Plakobranchus ocellatus]
MKAGIDTQRRGQKQTPFNTETRPRRKQLEGGQAKTAGSDVFSFRFPLGAPGSEDLNLDPFKSHKRKSRLSKRGMEKETRKSVKRQKEREGGGGNKNI